MEWRCCALVIDQQMRLTRDAHLTNLRFSACSVSPSPSRSSGLLAGRCCPRVSRHQAFQLQRDHGVLEQLSSAGFAVADVQDRRPRLSKDLGERGLAFQQRLLRDIDSAVHQQRMRTHC